MKPGSTFEDIVEEHAKFFEPHVRDGDTPWPLIFRVLLNSIFYIIYSGAEIDKLITNPEARKLWERSKRAKGRKRSRIQSQLSKMNDQRKRIVLGSSITINRQAPMYPSEVIGKGNGQKLRVRTLVSGHMRAQACGERWSKRKIIWIKPFWKGDEDAPISVPKHVVRGEPHTIPDEEPHWPAKDVERGKR